MNTVNLTVLDDIEAVKRVDASDMLAKLMTLGQQCRHAVEIATTVPVPEGLGAVSSIVVSGLGGSAIGGDLLRSYLEDSIEVPVLVNRQYTLPQYVSDRSFLFVVSYSGNTEETVSAFEIALKRNVPLVCITSGGILAERAAVEKKCVVLVPSGYPPRAALGYLFFAMSTILARVGFGIAEESETDETVAMLLKKSEQYHPSVPVDQNVAKQLAARLYGRIPLLYASEMLSPVARRWQTQIDENAETLAHSNIFPELNHNEIMSWKWLHGQKDMFTPVLLRDQADHPHLRKREDISRELLASDGLSPLEVWSEGESKLARLFSLICLGDFVSYYLAILRSIDPTPVARIEYLKARLKNSNI